MHAISPQLVTDECPGLCVGIELARAANPLNLAPFVVIHPSPSIPPVVYRVHSDVCTTRATLAHLPPTTTR